MLDADVLDSWQRIEAWLRSHMPWVCDRLAPGTTDARLDAAEAEMGFAFPSSLRKSYAHHDGLIPSHVWQKGPILEWDTRPSGFLYEAENFYSLDDVLADWRGLKDCPSLSLLEDEADLALIDFTGPIRRDTSYRWLIPLCRANRIVYYLDMNPAPGGQVGQVIRGDFDAVHFHLVAPSYSSWLAVLAQLLETDAYVYSHYAERIKPVNEAMSELEDVPELTGRARTPVQEAAYQRFRSIVERIGRS